MDNEAPGALAAGPDRRGDAAVTDLSGKRKSFAPWIIALVFVGVTIAIFASGVHRYLSFSTLVTYQDSLHDMVARNPAVAPLLFVLASALAVAFSIPGAVVLTVTSGFLFGGILGTMLTLTGATIGVAGIYAIAGSALGPAVKRLVEGRLASINEGFREGVWSYLFFLRLVPLFPFWVVNLATASCRCRLFRCWSPPFSAPCRQHSPFPSRAQALPKSFAVRARRCAPVRQAVRQHAA